MSWNWVDWVILLMLAGGIYNGFREGLVRLVVGFGAMIVGFFAASWLNGLVASYFSPYISNRLIAVVLAYALIFGGVMLLGAIIASLIVRVFKLIGLSLIDRVLGALFGGVRALVILVIATMVLMAFLPNRLPIAAARSTFAPYLIGASRLVSMMTPYEIRAAVEKQVNTLRSLKFVPLREE